MFIWHLIKYLPDESPIGEDWPDCSPRLMETSYLLKSIHHKWRVSFFFLILIFFVDRNGFSSMSNLCFPILVFQIPNEIRSNGKKSNA